MELIQSHFLLLTITAFFFFNFFFFFLPEVAFPSTVSCCSYPRPSICQNKCMWVINAERNVCWNTGNFLFRKRSWELPVEECIVGLLAAGPWPQLQLTKGRRGKGEEEEETATHRHFYPCRLRREWANTALKLAKRTASLPPIFHCIPDTSLGFSQTSSVPLSVCVLQSPTPCLVSLHEVHEEHPQQAGIPSSASELPHGYLYPSLGAGGACSSQIQKRVDIWVFDLFLFDSENMSCYGL